MKRLDGPLLRDRRLLAKNDKEHRKASRWYGKGIEAFTSTVCQAKALREC